MVEKFSVEKISRTPAANFGGGGKYVEVPVPGCSEDTNVNGNDDTTGHCVRSTRYGQVLEPWTGAKRR